MIDINNDGYTHTKNILSYYILLRIVFESNFFCPKKIPTNFS